MVFRRRSSQPDPFDVNTVSAAYRSPVIDALRTRDQFVRLVATVQPGPLRDTLDALGARVEAGVRAVLDTARRATDLEQVVASLDPERVQAELKQARRGGASADVIETLTARFASTQRLLDALDDMRDALPVLEARLSTAVARTAELALTASSAVGLADVGRELDTLVVQLTALQQANAELG